MSQFESCLGQASDNAQLQHLFSVPQNSSGVSIAFGRAPDYFNSQAVMYNDGRLLLVKNKQHGDIAAATNMGKRWLYVDGQPQLVRYGADMRIAPSYQGGRALLYINRAVKEEIGNDWYLTVILQDNQRSKNSFENARAGLPIYRKLGMITTYTITSAKQKKSEHGLVQAQVSDIDAMNQFVAELAQQYQFLPYYDFNELLNGAAYFKGLSIDDFWLRKKDGKITGLVGLWDQHLFKQAKVMAYSRALTIIKPFFNVFSALTGGLKLPKVGDNFDYLTLHSPLTATHDLESFDELLQGAWQLTQQRGFSSMAVTLADNDPRQAVLKSFRHQTLKANHYSVAYNNENQPNLQQDWVYYYECGRL